MAFGDYTGGSDSVVARLEMAMPEDMDQKLATVQKSVSSLETSLASATRFMKDFMDYAGGLPKIAEHMESIRQLGQAQAGGPMTSSDPTARNMPMPVTPPPTTGGPTIPSVEVLAPHPGAGGHGGTTGSSTTGGQTTIHADTVNMTGNATVLPASKAPVPTTALPASVADAQASYAAAAQAPAAQPQPASNAAQPVVGGQALPSPAQAQGGRFSHVGATLGALGAGLAGLSEHERQQQERAHRVSGGASAQLQSLMDYRAKLSEQLNGDPARLLNRMWQEGMTSEEMVHGQAEYGVKFGKTRMGVQDFMANQSAQQDAIDELARRTQPQSPSNGSTLQRLTHGMHIASSLLGAMTPGADPVQTIGHIGDMLNSMIKSGNGQINIPNVTGRLTSMFGGGATHTSTVSENTPTPAMPTQTAPTAQAGIEGEEDAVGGREQEQGGSSGLGQAAKQYGQQQVMGKVGGKLKETWQQYASKGAHRAGAQAGEQAGEQAAKTAASTAARAGAGAAEAGAGELAGTVASTVAPEAAAGGLLAGGAVALAPIALAVGGFMAAQKMGQQYQQTYNQGTVQGGGFGAGLASEGKIQMMALNPFITTDQSRQIIMGALNEGYQGDQFDNVTSFMEKNLTTMNMSVADSTKLLRKNVDEGGQSIAGLSVQLQNLKDSAKEGGVSLGDRIAQFTQLSGQGVSAGGGGAASGALAAAAAELFAPMINGEKNPLADKGSEIISAAMNSPGVAQRIAARHYPGLTGATARAKAIQDGSFNTDTVEIVQQLMRQAGNGPNRDDIFNRLYNQTMGTSEDIQTTADIFQQFSGRSAQQITADADNRRKASAHNETREKGGGELAGSSLQGLAGGFWHGITSIFHSDETNAENRAQDQGNFGRFENPALNKVTRAHGLDNTVVYDPQGNAHKVDYDDEAQMKGLADGSWKIATADTDEDKKALSDDWKGASENMKSHAKGLTDLATDGSSDTSDSSAKVGGTFGLTPQASQLLYLLPNHGVTSDSNTVNSNSGTNGATPNDPSGAPVPTMPTGTG